MHKYCFRQKHSNQFKTYSCSGQRFRTQNDQRPEWIGVSEFRTVYGGPFVKWNISASEQSACRIRFSTIISWTVLEDARRNIVVFKENWIYSLVSECAALERHWLLVWCIRLLIQCALKMSHFSCKSFSNIFVCSQFVSPGVDRYKWIIMRL